MNEQPTSSGGKTLLRGSSELNHGLLGVLDDYGMKCYWCDGRLFFDEAEYTHHQFTAEFLYQM